MINLLNGIDSTAAALRAERIRMEVVGNNIANANVSRGIDGLPYQRQEVIFESVLSNTRIGDGAPVPSLNVARIESDNRPPRMIADPGHPDADPVTGLRAVPDINIHEEMADYMIASRAYEANLSVVKTARSIAMQTLSIGKQV
ncbi:MAG TPA: flagellar basal body rod protein FlgC [Verrucomicrobiales bacterium]|nr:flagellar basal body rod protein FlgC [Verrucomicrobiales bacterium]